MKLKKIAISLAAVTLVSCLGVDSASHANIVSSATTDAPKNEDRVYLKTNKRLFFVENSGKKFDTILDQIDDLDYDPSSFTASFESPGGIGSVNAFPSLVPNIGTTNSKESDSDTGYYMLDFTTGKVDITMDGKFKPNHKYGVILDKVVSGLTPGKKYSVIRYYDEENFQIPDEIVKLRKADKHGELEVQYMIPVYLDGEKPADNLNPEGIQPDEVENYLKIVESKKAAEKKQKVVKKTSTIKHNSSKKASPTTKVNARGYITVHKGHKVRTYTLTGKFSKRYVYGHHIYRLNQKKKIKGHGICYKIYGKNQWIPSKYLNVK